MVLDGEDVADVGIGLTAVGAAHFCAPEAEDAAFVRHYLTELETRP